MSVATVSAKGWVVIPKTLRKQFNLEPGSKVRFVLDSFALLAFAQDQPGAAEVKFILTQASKGQARVFPVS